jgi:hypothetical protein
VERTLVIPRRYCGPLDSANGGYTCGLLAGLLGTSSADVTLVRPPPLQRELRFDGLDLWDGEELVAKAEPAEVDLDVPGPVSYDEAERAGAGFPGFEHHAFPMCFVCGPSRSPGDGLRIFTGPVEGRDVLAAPWQVPEEVDETLVWAALDCPGAVASGYPERGDTLLGRFAGRVDEVPRPGERCVVVAWPLGEDGRKLYAGTALFGDDARLLGLARAIWIEPRAS